jgi:hypothetical protein
LIELEGDQTKVDGNVTGGGGWYGLETEDTSSIIHLRLPLTKESVSTNNGGHGNHGGPGAIETINSSEEVKPHTAEEEIAAKLDVAVDEIVSHNIVCTIFLSRM